MNLEEIIKKLSESAKSASGKFLHWWEEDFDQSDDKNQIFTQKEVKEIEDYVRNCDIDTLSVTDNENGYSLFSLLVWHNFYDAVNIALTAGIPADLTDGKNWGVTPLLLACCRSNYAMAKLLAEYGADLAHCDAKGRNGFHYLAHPFAEGLKISEEPIHSLDQRKKIALLLAGCAEDGNLWKAKIPADKTPLPLAAINQKDAQGIPPLVYLVDGGLRMISAALIDTYLALGADPYFVDDAERTLLYRAILRGRNTAALRLMEYPELMEKEAKAEKTLLMIAEEHHAEGLCVALKDHGAKGECKLAEVDAINLARLADNAFTNTFGCKGENDELALGLYLTKKLLKLAEEDEDYGYLERVLEIPLRYGQTVILELLHHEGVDFTEPYYGGVDSINCLRDKCLEYCVDVPIIKKLLEFGVDMESTVIAGKTPVCILAQNKRCKSEIFSLFSVQSIEERDNYGVAALHYAVKREDTDALAVMLEQGANPNLPQDAPAAAGMTPLHLSCIYGNIEAAKLLIKFGANDAIYNAAGYSAAHYLLLRNKYRSELSSEDRIALFSLLIHIDLADDNGKTPLLHLFSWEMARMYLDMLPLLKILLEKGANVNQKDREGNTALLLCVDNFGGHLELVKALCEAGADLNAIDADGNNVLYYAMKAESQFVAKYLLKKGADYKHTNNEGVTPAQVAAEKGFDTLFTWMKDV